MESEVVNYRPAKLKPVTDPQEIRALTVRDYADKARRMGVDVPVASLERQAIADLHMVDAYQKGVDLSPRPKVRPRPKAEVPLHKADDLPLKAPTGQRTDPQAEAAAFLRLSSRWPFAMGRMKRILAGAVPNRDPIKVAMSCEVPELALEMLRLHRNYLTRGRESRQNPFRGLNDHDCRRVLVRMVEDICDRSASKMGPWWVPK